MITTSVHAPPALPWADITRLLVLEVTRSQLLNNSGPHPQPASSAPAAAHPATPSAVWSPSETANQLADIVHRHPEGAPRVSLMVQGETPDALARALREAVSHSGLSHHHQLAEGVHSANMAAMAPTLAPAGQQSFEATTMLLMTGQLRSHVETPMGPAMMVWHREDANPATGTPARICAVSVAIDHPQFGPLVAHLSIGTSELEVRLHCDNAVREQLQEHLSSLHQQLRHLQQATTVRMEPAA